MARPSSFTQEQADEICRRLAEGESLRKICADESMPQKRTVLGWLDEREDFRTQYARARAEQADHFAEEIVEIADEDPVSVFDTEKGEGGQEVEVQRVDSAAVAHQRLRIDARKWFASKVAPKKYGEKLELAGDKERPLTIEVVRFSDACAATPG